MACHFQTDHSRFGNRLLLGYCCRSDFGELEEVEGGRLRSLLGRRLTKGGHIDQVVGIVEGCDIVAVAVAGSAQHAGCCTRVVEEVIGLGYRAHLRLVPMVLVVGGAWVRLSAPDRVSRLRECVARRNVVVVA